MWFRKQTVKILCEACPDPYQADEANIIRTQDHGNVCNVCYELLRTIRSDEYWLKHHVRYRIRPYTADQHCWCLDCQEARKSEDKPRKGTNHLKPGADYFGSSGA